MKKKSVCFRFVTIFALLCLMMTAISSLSGAFAEVQSGIDLVILLDSSKSMKNNDKQYKRLDAAAMIINMCDSKQSAVAVVPFTDHVIDDDPWSEMIDVSDNSERENLVDKVINRETFGANSGVTSFTEALDKGYELLRERKEGGSKNKQVILLLSDGKNEKRGDQETAVATARKIKDLGAVIYGIYLGSASGDGIANLQEIAGFGNESGRKYVHVGADSEMVEFFSDIFAELIDSKKITKTISITGGRADIEIDVKTESVFEINLVIPTDIIAENADIEVYCGDELVRDSENVYAYEHRNKGKDTKYPYDYYSLKLIEPKAGLWHVRFDASGSADGTRFDYDILYNYDVNLVGAVDSESYYLNDDVVITALFEKADGSGATQDANMYDIPATFELCDASGNLVRSGNMQKAADGSCYTFTLPASALSGYGTYTVKMHAEDETMFRDSVNAVTFSVENGTPHLTDGADEPQDMGTIRIADILDTNRSTSLTSTEASCDIASYFADDDGDALTYTITGCDENIHAEIDGSELTVTVDDSINADACWVEVTAADGQNVTSEPVHLDYRLLSVRRLVDECVEVELTADKDDIHKGETVNLTAEYKIAVPEGKDETQMPYSSIGELTPEILYAAATGEFDHTEDEGITFADTSTENAYRASVSAEMTEGAKSTVSFTARIANLTITSNAKNFEVTNACPEAKDVTAALTDIGGISEPRDGSDIIFFNVDRDKPADVLTFDMTDWFVDSDTQYGGESLSYSVQITPLEETKDIFALARKILRMVGMADKDGEIVTLDGGSYDTETGIVTADIDGKLDLTAVRFGNALVTVTAADNSGATAMRTIGYHVTSSAERLKCLIVYAIMLVILVIIVIILINRLVIHAVWPGRRAPGYSVVLNTFEQVTLRGERESNWNKTGRGAYPLSVFAKQFDIQDGGAGNSLFAKIKLWPTVGGAIVVERTGSKWRDGDAVKVGGRPLGKKAKWLRGGRIECYYKDSSGIPQTCVFIRK